MTTEIPLSDKERWDANAEKVKGAKGEWVEIDVVGNSGSHHQKIRHAFARRGVVVEVQSRIGNESPERPWSGAKTWARCSE